MTDLERGPYGIATHLEHRADRHPEYQLEDVSHVLLHGKPTASQHPALNAVLARLALEQAS